MIQPNVGEENRQLEEQVALNILASTVVALQ